MSAAQATKASKKNAKRKAKRQAEHERALANEGGDGACYSCQAKLAISPDVLCRHEHTAANGPASPFETPFLATAYWHLFLILEQR